MRLHFMPILTIVQDVGHPESFDVVSRGLANLIYWCASFAKASQRPLPPK